MQDQGQKRSNYCILNTLCMMCVKVMWGQVGSQQKVGHCVFGCAEAGDEELTLHFVLLLHEKVPRSTRASGDPLPLAPLQSEVAQYPHERNFSRCNVTWRGRLWTNQAGIIEQRDQSCLTPTSFPDITANKIGPKHSVYKSSGWGKMDQ